MKHTKKLLIVLTIAWVLLLMVVFSDAWIARNWTPSISQQSITISSSSALLISLDPTGDNLYGSVNINEMVGSDEFTLRQVSSHDAKLFHRVDFLPTITGGEPIFTTQDVEDRYINCTFYLMRQISNNPEEASEKLVFIHPDTHISCTSGNADVSKAIRVAITIDNNAPIILADCSDNLYNGSRPVLAPKEGANGENVYEDYDPSPTVKNEYNRDVVATQTAYSLLYYHGGRTSFDDDDDPSNDYNFTPNEDRALVKMQEGQVCTVNVKIWLEGSDDTCTEAIAGQVFDFLLKFDSVDVQTVRTEA